MVWIYVEILPCVIADSVPGPESQTPSNNDPTTARVLNDLMKAFEVSLHQIFEPCLLLWLFCFLFVFMVHIHVKLASFRFLDHCHANYAKDEPDSSYDKEAPSPSHTIN